MSQTVTEGSVSTLSKSRCILSIKTGKSQHLKVSMVEQTNDGLKVRVQTAESEKGGLYVVADRYATDCLLNGGIAGLDGQEFSAQILKQDVFVQPEGGEAKTQVRRWVQLRRVRQDDERQPVQAILSLGGRDESRNASQEGWDTLFGGNLMLAIAKS